MMQVMVPTWHDLVSLVKKAKRELVICTPFYSESGLKHVQNNLKGKARIQIFTRISPSDWANRISDPEALLDFLTELVSKGHAVTVYINQRLHAKAYISNKQNALVGSSNLSDGGFENNLEIMIKIDGRLAGKVAQLMNRKIKPEAKKISIKKLKKWVNRYKKDVANVRKSTEKNQANRLSHAQRNLDRMLGFGGKKTPIRRISPKELSSFFNWLKKHSKLPGGSMIIVRYKNTDGQNLQGHVKQCFFSGLRFLTEKPSLQRELSQALEGMKRNDVYQLSDAVSAAWLSHMNRHATDKTGYYDYAILRGILPPSVGGTRIGGGGGISTLKRLLPLIARYLRK